MYNSFANPSLETDVSISGCVNDSSRFLRELRFKALRSLFRPLNIVPSNIWIVGNKSLIEILLIVAVFAFFIALSSTSDSEGSGSIAEIAGIITILFSLKNNILNWFLGISFERSIFWHRMLGSAFIITSLIHGFMNLVGEWEVVGDDEKVTGVIMVGLFLAIGLSYFVRHLNFEVFYYVHIALYASSIPIAFLHGADKFGLCCLAWAIDLSIRYYFASITHMAVVSAQPGEIVQVRVDKKLNFTPGQFCFIMIPSISCVQFHPFTISSSPHEDYFTFNIKATGDWTKQLYDMSRLTPSTSSDVSNNDCVIADSVPSSSSKDENMASYKPMSTPPQGDQPPSNSNMSNDKSSSSYESCPASSSVAATIPRKKEVADSTSRNKSNRSGNSGGRELTIYLEGPFGAPTIDVVGSTYEVLLFICGGIGVTPCYSFMQYIRQQKRFNSRNIKKLVFIWSSRDADIFDSFSLDIPLESNPQNDFSSDDLVHFELYLTKGGVGGAKTAPLSKYGSALKHSRPNIVDIVNRTAIYASDNKINRVGVVTCGPAAMIEEVQDVCKRFQVADAKVSAKIAADDSRIRRNQDSAVCFDVHSEVFDF